MSTGSSISRGSAKLGFLDKLIRDYSGLAITMVAIFVIVFLYGMVTAPNFSQFLT